MGILNNPFKKEKRQQTVADLYPPKEISENNFMSLDALFGRKPDSVGRAEIENIIPVSSNVDILSSIIASLPVELYKTGKNGIEKVKKDNRLKLLNIQPNNYESAIEMKRKMIQDYLYQGSGFIHITKKGNKIEKLDYIDRSNMSFVSNFNVLSPEYKYSIQAKNVELFEMIAIKQNTSKNFMGNGIVQNNQDILQQIQSTNKWKKDLAKNRGAGRLLISTIGKVSDNALKALKESYEKLYSDDKEGAIVANAGVEVKTLSANFKDMEVALQSKESIQLANSLLGIPDTVKLGSASEEVFNNFVTTTINPILSLIEVALCNSLLLESEKGKYFFKISVDDLIKGNSEKRYNTYDKAIRLGVMTIDEVRTKENMLTLGGVAGMTKLSLADGLYNHDTGMLTVLNTGQRVNILDDKETPMISDIKASDNEVENITIEKEETINEDTI